MSYVDFKRELGFLFSKKSVVALLVVTFLLSCFSVWTGTEEINQQRETISRLIKADQIDREDVIDKKSDYGSMAYYTFNLTYSPPSELAFAALGSRDSMPWKHRIRALALEGQIHESDTGNPEMALTGRIDFNFMISILAPLLVILLLHDLKASEMKNGREELLSVTSRKKNSIWLSRVFVSIFSISICLLIPFWIASVINMAGLGPVLLVSFLTAAHIALWAFICYWASKKSRSAPHIASGLLGAWLLVTFIIPAGSSVFIERTVTGPQGGEILMAQREAVNDAWEIPIEITMAEFVKTYPEWKGHTSMDGLFDWKWYFAFHQVGDQKVQPLVSSYRKMIEKRYDNAGWVSLVSPATFVSRTFTRLANTDPISAWEYEDRVRAYHTSLKEYFYPYLFKKVEFDKRELDKLPKYNP